MDNAHTSTCLQSRCIACLPRPQMKMAGCLRAARRCLRTATSEFWRPNCASWRAAQQFFILPSSFSCGAAAGNRTRMVAVRKHSTWQEDILLLNHSREIKRAGSCVGLWPFARTSRPMPFQQRTNTSCYLAIPTHGFTVVLSVFRGTPPIKPLNCKSVSNHLGARLRSRWADPTGGKPRHSGT